MFPRRITPQAARLMALEYGRIHNAAYQLYKEQFAQHGTTMIQGEQAGILQRYYIGLFEDSLRRTQSFDHAKATHQHLPRPDTSLKDHAERLSPAELANVRRALNEKVDEIHAAALGAVAQAWKQLGVSGL